MAEMPTAIATGNMTYVDKDASVFCASKLMRESGATQLLVIEASADVFVTIGVLTACDIVNRVIAAGLDPAVLTAGDIAWSGSQAQC